MIPRPNRPELDAVVQEVQYLQATSGGEILYMNPARRPGSRYPERLYGLHRLLFLRQRETNVRLHHVFHAHLLLFPYLRWLRRPIIYSITAGLRSSHRPRDIQKLGRLAAIVVSNGRDRATLQDCGLENVHVIRPGIDTTRFDRVPPPNGSGFTLLAGSAPWTKAQFRSKGVEALLTAAETRSDLRLIFLWRGLLFEEMQALVNKRGLQDRVRIINQLVDVNQVLSSVHAAVVLAMDPKLVKAYPHSLLEALAAGRPVLVSRNLPIADYVAKTGCGCLIDTVSPDGILSALEDLERSYAACQSAACSVGQRDFSLSALTEAYRALYASLE